MKFLADGLIMAEAVGPNIIPIRMFSPRADFTVVDMNRDGVLKPEDGDGVYEGHDEKIEDSSFPSLKRVDHSYWKNTSLKNIYYTLDQYMAREEYITPLWYGALVVFGVAMTYLYARDFFLIPLTMDFI